MTTLDINLARQKLKRVEINCIRQRLAERGLSQKWVAQKLNKTCNTVNGWCCNRVQPHLIDLYLLSALLNCSVHELIGDLRVRELMQDGAPDIAPQGEIAF